MYSKNIGTLCLKAPIKYGDSALSQHITELIALHGYAGLTLKVLMAMH